MELGDSFRGDLLAIFLAWCGFGALIGVLVTSRRRLAEITGLGVAVIGTVLTANPWVTGYWWVLVGSSILLVLVRKNSREKVMRTGRVLGEVLFGTRTYREERLMRIIRNLAIEHKRAYKIVRDSVETEIDQNGTSDTNRFVELAATRETISWIDLMIGVTAANPQAEGVLFESPIILDANGRPLDYEYYEDTEASKRMLIFLREPLRIGGPTQILRMSRQVRRSWIALIQRLEDFGTYMPQNQVDEVTLRIKVPSSLRISEFRIEPSVGQASISQDKLTAIWSATAIQAGESYRYIITCLRT